MKKSRYVNKELMVQVLTESRSIAQVAQHQGSAWLRAAFERGRAGTAADISISVVDDAYLIAVHAGQRHNESEWEGLGGSSMAVELQLGKP